VIHILIAIPTFVLPRRALFSVANSWTHSTNWMLRVICNIKVEVRGAANIPAGPLLVAGKHQSAWETTALPTYFSDPCMVEKKELFYIPIYGWPYTYKFRMIGVDRSGGAKSLKNLVARGKQEIAIGRQIIIMPEGTRRPVGAPPKYKSGAAALYANLAVPCLPFGLNSGQHWPRRKFLRYPGTIVIEFGQVIPAGLPRKEFQKRMEEEIESITSRLISETRS